MMIKTDGYVHVLEVVLNSCLVSACKNICAKIQLTIYFSHYMVTIDVMFHIIKREVKYVVCPGKIQANADGVCDICV